MKKCDVHHLISITLLKELGLPSAPWCTTQVSGAERRTIVHTVALYSRSGTQLQRMCHNCLNPNTQACRWTMSRFGNTVNPAALLPYYPY